MNQHAEYNCNVEVLSIAIWDLPPFRARWGRGGPCSRFSIIYFIILWGIVCRLRILILASIWFVHFASYYLVCCRIQYCIFRVVYVVAFLILFVVFVVAVVHLCRHAMLLHFLREGKERLNGGISQLVKMKHEQNSWRVCRVMSIAFPGNLTNQ